MRKKEIFYRGLTYISGALVFFLVGFLFLYIFFKGYKVINLNFLLDVPQGMVLGQEGGIAPAIIGSFLSTFIACGVAGFFGIFTSIHLVFYEKNQRKIKIIQSIIKCIGGIPSIVFGLFGYTLFTLYFGFGKSIISGGLTLGIMIFPVVEIRIEKSLREIDENILRASYSMGVSKFYTIYKIGIPYCLKEIIASILLGYNYAIGATAPIMFCMAVINSPISFDIKKPAMSLSYHLYTLMTQGISMEMAYGTAFILLALIVVVTIIFQILLRKRDE